MGSEVPCGSRRAQDQFVRMPRLKPSGASPVFTSWGWNPPKSMSKPQETASGAVLAIEARQQCCVLQADSAARHHRARRHNVQNVHQQLACQVLSLGTKHRPSISAEDDESGIMGLLYYTYGGRPPRRLPEAPSRNIFCMLYRWVVV